MRIVGGRLRGRRLAAPSGNATRPTSDRLRETLFDILAHRFGVPVETTRVLDLFAGTGALGLEALSRGAAYALFIENGAAARGTIRRNVDEMGVAGVTRVFRRDATRLGAAGTLQPFDLVFADPPYGRGAGERALLSAMEGGWVADGAIAVLEEAAGADAQPVEGFETADVRSIGGSQLRIFNARVTGRRTPQAPILPNEHLRQTREDR